MAEDGGGERVSSEITARSISTLRRSVGSPLLFAIVYTPLASALYFCLGVIAGRALGLTPLVFVISSLLFTLTALTYAEGASMHPERSGSTVFARYAFNELISFVAGWAILLDYIILIAVTTYSATQYLSVFSSPLGDRDEALILALLFIAVVVVGNIRGLGGRRARRIGVLVIADLAMQAFIVILGLALFFSPDKLLDPIHLGSAPRWSDFVFALTVAAISFTSLESAAGVAGEVRISSAALKRLIMSGTGTVVIVYTGIALVAVTALPVHGGHTELASRYLNLPMVGIATQLGDARALAAGLLAFDESPDPDRPRAAAPATLHAVRADPRSGRDRRRPGGDRGPRLSGRHLRVRRDARVHDRPPFDLPPALLRAAARPSLQGAAVHRLALGAAAAAGRGRCADIGRGMGCGDGRARAGTVRGAGLADSRPHPVRGLPARR